MKCEIRKLGFREYYAYYRTDGWHLLGYYTSERSARRALKERKDEIERSRKYRTKLLEFEI